MHVNISSSSLKLVPLAFARLFFWMVMSDNVYGYIQNHMIKDVLKQSKHGHRTEVRYELSPIGLLLFKLLCTKSQEAKQGRRYGYIKNHNKTVKNRQARESEEYKKKPRIQSRSQKSKNSPHL
ncbi:hypothetical protein Tco_0158969 [Tanacetum coccineum]